MLVSFCSLACGEGRTKGLSAELQEGSEASPCAWGPCLGIGLLQPFGRASMSNLMAYCVPGDYIMLAPGLGAQPGQEKGLQQGWRPKPKGTTEKPGLWFLAHGVSQAHRRVWKEPLWLLPVKRAQLLEGRPDCEVWGVAAKKLRGEGRGAGGLEQDY